jgi:Protein of unknown function DUF262
MGGTPTNTPQENTSAEPQNLTLQLEQERRTVSFDSYDIAVRQLVEMVEENAIDIAPEYQRKFVWEPERQSEFIESVFLGIPTPSLFMATNKDSTWEVVDGVQRISTLVNFCGTEELRYRVLHSREPLTLTGLEKLTTCNGKRFLELPRSVQLAFWTRPMRVTTLNDKSDLAVRFDLFERLNSGGVKLQPQEIRNCVYRGPFNDALKDLSQNRAFRNTIRLSGDDETNGTYEEWVLRFFAFLERYREFGHSVLQFLNRYMEDANRQMPSASTLERFPQTFQFLAAELPDGIIRGGRRITPVNLYEAIAVGTALLFSEGRQPQQGRLATLLNDTELRDLTSGGTNSRVRVIGRIEFVRDRLR